MELMCREIECESLILIGSDISHPSLPRFLLHHEEYYYILKYKFHGSIGRQRVSLVSGLSLRMKNMRKSNYFSYLALAREGEVASLQGSYPPPYKKKRKGISCTKKKRGILIFPHKIMRIMTSLILVCVRKIYIKMFFNYFSSFFCTGGEPGNEGRVYCRLLEKACL